MDTSSDLFDLIQSLSAAEKKYFKQHSVSSTVGRNMNYLSLFDVLSRQKIYNEKKVNEKLRKKGFTENLSQTRHYLFNAILKSMISLRLETDQRYQVRRMCDYAEYLLDKGLVKLSEKFLEKAIKKAFEEEAFLILLDLLRIQKNILHRRLHYEPVEALKKIESNYKMNKNVIDLISNQNEYWNVTEQIFAFQVLSSTARNKNLIEKYRSFIENPLMSDENKALSFKARSNYYAGLGTYYRLIGDDVNAHAVYKKHVDFIESRMNNMPAESSKSYPSALRNLIISQMNLHYLSDAEENINKFMISPISMPKDYRLRNYAALTLSLLNASGRFEDGVKFIKKVQKEFFKIIFNKHSREDLAHYHYYCTCIYIGKGDFKNALAGINKLFNEENLRDDVRGIGMLLNLIIHYEIKNENLLSLVVSARRFFTGRDRLYQAESYLIDFFRKLSKADDPEQQKIYFITVLNKMKQLQRDPFEKNFFLYFDFISWLASKIAGRSFTEIVREKAHSNQAG